MGEDEQVPTVPSASERCVSLCYQASEFGPSLTLALDNIRDVIAHHKLFV